MKGTLVVRVLCSMWDTGSQGARMVDAVASKLTVTLLAVLSLHQREGRVTFRGVASSTGVAPSTAYRRCCHLRDLGLVEFDDRRAATLRPMVGVVG